MSNYYAPQGQTQLVPRALIAIAVVCSIIGTLALFGKSDAGSLAFGVALVVIAGNAAIAGLVVTYLRRP